MTCSLLQHCFADLANLLLLRTDYTGQQDEQQGHKPILLTTPGGVATESAQPALPE